MRVAIFAFLTATAVTGQGAAPEVAALQRAFRKAAKPELLQVQRSRALDAVRRLDDAAVARALVRAFERLESECAPIVKKRRDLLLKDSGERLERLRVRLQPLRSLQRRVHTQLAKLKSRPAHVAIGKMLADKRLPLRLKLLGARVAGQLFDASRMRPAGRQPIEELLAILEATKSLGRKGKELGRFAVDALQRPEPIVKARAVDALAAICWHGGLQPLVDLLKRETDHDLKVRAGDALCVLTKQNLGPSHVSWSAWLAQKGGPYLGGRMRLGGGNPSKAERTAGGYYFGIPLDRSSILFVHDNSLSMRQQLGDEKRIDRSRDELCQALDSLKPTQRFNIVLLANRVWSFETKQVAATVKNVRRAKTWVRYQPIELGTNIYNALEAGFVLAGRGARDRYYDTEIDTIFLLSDGAPTRHLKRGRGGQPNVRENPNHILHAVERWNLFDRIEIHTIFLGGGRRGQNRPRQGNRGGRGNRANRFMRLLAEQNNGRSKVVDK